MERYINFAVDPDVTVFDILNDAIREELCKDDIFLYTSRGAGKYNIEQMKSIAVNSGRLNHFIHNNVIGLHDMKVSNFSKKY